MKSLNNQFEFKFSTKESTWTNTCLNAAITAVMCIEALLTAFQPANQTNQINA